MASVLRGAVALIAVGLSVALTACSGGSGALTPAGTSDGPAYSLGLVRADPATLAALGRVRSVESAASLPAAADLSGRMPPVGYQGNEGSCAAWAAAYALRGYEARRDVWSGIPASTAAPAFNFSPAFVYDQLDGGVDGGISIPAALNLMRQQGVATLADMPYVAGQYRTQPTAAARADAARYKIGAFGVVDPADLTAIKAQLARGVPVVFGFKVYKNFFGLGAGAIYSNASGPYEGGHAVTIVGYDDTKRAFKFINSWGTGWGSAGYGWFAYTVMPQLALEAYAAIDGYGAP